MSLPQNFSLNGEWDFFYSPKQFTPLLTALPAAEEYTGKMVTPGYWDDHYELYDEEDFFGLTARFNPDYRKPHFPMGRSLTPHAASSFLVGTGYYRKRFFVTEEFNCATLTVGPAMWGCCVYCNGNFAGSVTGYSTASTYVLDDFLRVGEENELIIVVCNVHDDGGAYHRVDGSHNGVVFGTRPGQHRGLAAQGYQSERAGINGGVWLKFTKKAELTDYFISFASGIPLWHVETRGGKAELEWKISQNGSVVDSGALAIDGCAEFTSAVPPVLWSDRNPALCDIELILKDNGQVIDSANFKWGARQVTVNGMELQVNGIPTFFRGVTEHCYFADTTNPHYDKEKYLRELGVIRAAGFNFIRCHTWCPPEPFYEACDELGFLVQTEFPSIWSFDEAEAIIKQIRRHSSAVILCEGNEKIIDEVAIVRMQRLIKMLHSLAPGMLYNPQEAMRGIEYEFTPGRKLIKSPLHHDPERLDRVREFSDCFGCLGGEFSYIHDEFPGRDYIEARNAVYQRPCLSHESGILGGALDFAQEERYKGTFIGTDLFEAARENMQKHGVYEKERIYYEKNSLFISSCRKQLIENLRSCRNMAGFDYLGGIDTHWHLIGYPCGVFNEFYEEKYGETIADVRRYCGESILLCTAGRFRNLQENTVFSQDIEFTCFESAPVKSAILKWSFETMDGKIIASGENTTGNLPMGQVIPVGKVEFALPVSGKGVQAILKATLSADGKEWENFWKFWIFPAGEFTMTADVKVCDKLDDAAIAFMENGGKVLLTDNFPGEALEENFRSHTSGRSLGHGGALLNPHPVWNKYPHENFQDWQFYPLMHKSKSLVYDREMPEFAPAYELIPSFKLVKHKSMLSEFTVGKGRLMISGFRFDADDPGAKYMLRAICEYLAEDASAPAPAWCADDLRKRISSGGSTGKTGKRMDAGGRPIDD